MQTQLADFIKHTPQGLEAATLLRSCVHCGFCNASCPTYQLLGDELDGPRGRIYLIKQLLEGETGSACSQLHLDRCLSCRACETACPSAVNYHRLLDIGRGISEQQVARPWRQRWLRRLLLLTLPYPGRFRPIIAFGRRLRPLLPKALQAKLPARQAPGGWPAVRHARRMLILEGCVQAALAPRINAATARVLDKLGISPIAANAGCCGALPYHLNDQPAGLEMMRRVIDACWPHVENGIEAIVSTASGCGISVKDYAALLRNDPLYAEKAARISALTKDIAEILQAEDISPLQPPARTLAFHSPCTLQHGQQLNGVVENLLSGLGFSLTLVAEPHLCCGSAGTYSILQPELAGRLRAAKIQALQAGQPAIIATANIGCRQFLQEKAQVPVVHWIELLDC
jgi:glycolate oxidase iron-sulfur subunit